MANSIILGGQGNLPCLATEVAIYTTELILSVGKKVLGRVGWLSSQPIRSIYISSGWLAGDICCHFKVQRHQTTPSPQVGWGAASLQWPTAACPPTWAGVTGSFGRLQVLGGNPGFLEVVRQSPLWGGIAGRGPSSPPGPRGVAGIADRRDTRHTRAL